MSFLEDRLLRILELRKLGKDDDQIAKFLNLSKNVTLAYEKLIYNRLKNKEAFNLENIAKEIGVSYGVVELYRAYYTSKQIDKMIEEDVATIPDIFSSKPIYKSNCKTMRNQAILDTLIAEGLPIKDIAEKVSLCKGTVSNYIRKSGQYEKWREDRYKKGKRGDNLDKVIENKDVINEFLIDGEKLKDIAYVTEIDYQSLRRYVANNSLYDKWKEAKSRKNKLVRIIGRRGKMAENKELIDRMIDEGKTLKDMAMAGNVTRQAVDLYLNYGDRREKWEKAKVIRNNLEDSIKNREAIGTKIVDILVSCMYRKATDEGYEEAVRYYYGNRKGSRRSIQIPLNKLIKLVETYKEARDSNTKLTHSDLARTARIRCVSSLEHIFDKVGFESLTWHRETNSFYKNRRKFITNVAKTLDYLSSRDLGYFLGINYPTIINITKHRKVKRKTGFQSSAIKYWIEYNGPRIKDVIILTYRDASQIYGFKDEFKVSREEISDAIEKDVRVVNYALRHRKEIEPKLIKALKVMYSKEKINKPYR